MPDTAYDAVPYQSNPYPQTHPDHLAVMATLFGMRPASPDGCRVLELGCGAGGNLIPMAATRPGSTFVGVDLAASAVASGNALIASLGLTNVELRHGSVLEVDASWGTYDFVVCHGMYSWVPDDVRAGILRAVRATLAPHGVGFVSYNTLPGWSLRGMVRDMMMFHIRDIDDPMERVSQSRALVEFLVKSTPEGTDYGAVLRAERKRLSQLADWYIYHDNLAPDLRAFWFNEFSAHLDAAGLQYLADAALSTMVLSNLPEAAVSALSKLGGELLRTEQYMDYVRFRQFRQSLVVHTDVELDRQLDWHAIERFAFTSRVRPVDPAMDPRAPGKAEFTTAEGIELNTEVPLAKAMLLELHERRPVPIPFDELVAAARRRVSDAPSDDPAALEADRAVVGQNVFSCFASDVVLPRLTWPRFITEVSERPEVSPYARAQSSLRLPYLTNLRHEGVEVDELDRNVAALLDGTRTIEELVEELIARVRTGDLVVRKQEGPFESEEELRSEMTRAAHLSVNVLLRAAVLVG